MGEAPAPVNVRFELRDGTEIPVDCVFVGCERGNAIWRTVRSAPPEFKALLMDALPAHCGVQVPLPGTDL